MGCPPQWEAYGRDCFLASEVKAERDRAQAARGVAPAPRSRSSRTRASWGWPRLCAKSLSGQPGMGCWLGGSDHTCRLEKKVGFEGAWLRGGLGEGATEQTCCDACRGTSGCAGWVLDTSLGRCTLFATIVATYPANEMVAGHVGGGAWRWEDNTEMSLEQLGATGRRWGAWAKARTASTPAC